jgi:AraC family transcriptional regulator
MTPKIIEKEQIILIGMDFYGDPMKDAPGWSVHNEIGKLWNRFMAFWGNNKHRVKNLVNPDVAYEVHTQPEESGDVVNWSVFVGMEVENLENIPVELMVKVLPPTRYAVFTLKGQEITSDWTTPIYEEWLPNSDYENAHPFLIEYYDSRFKGMENVEESEIDVYVPIK